MGIVEMMALLILKREKVLLTRDILFFATADEETTEFLNRSELISLSRNQEIHDLCVRMKIPVWCGGMLETGIGRAHNIAMSTLSGFTLPGDVSASKRYYHQDVINRRLKWTHRDLFLCRKGQASAMSPIWIVLKR
jgi:hypothetical protein